MAEVTTSEAAQMLGVARESVRRQLSRWGIRAVGRDTDTGEKLWSAEAIRKAIAERPGRGARTDLRRGRDEGVRKTE